MPLRGYDRALGSFLLDPTTAETLGREPGEAEAFIDYLQGGKYLPQEDLRARFAGLTDYLKNVRAYQEEGGAMPIDSGGGYFGVFGHDPTKADIIGAGTAALGYSRGMGARARRNLIKAYDALGKQRFAPGLTEPSGSRFADWLSTAFK